MGKRENTSVKGVHADSAFWIGPVLLSVLHFLPRVSDVLIPA